MASDMGEEGPLIGFPTTVEPWSTTTDVEVEEGVSTYPFGTVLAWSTSRRKGSRSRAYLSRLRRWIVVTGTAFLERAVLLDEFVRGRFVADIVGIVPRMHPNDGSQAR